MSIAERTREAVDRYPFLLEGLRTGVVNYTAAARFLDIGDTDAVAAALRRYADELGPPESPSADVRLRMITGVGEAAVDEPLLTVDGRTFATGEGELTAVVASGRIHTRGVGGLLWRLAEDGTDTVAVGATDDGLAVVVERGDGPRVLKMVEETVSGDPRD